MTALYGGVMRAPRCRTRLRHLFQATMVRCSCRVHLLDYIEVVSVLGINTVLCGIHGCVG